MMHHQKSNGSKNEDSEFQDVGVRGNMVKTDEVHDKKIKRDGAKADEIQYNGTIGEKSKPGEIQDEGIRREKSKPDEVRNERIGREESMKDDEIRKVFMILLIPLMGLLIGYILSVLFLGDIESNGPGSGRRNFSATYTSVKTAVLFGNLCVLFFLGRRYYLDFKETKAQFTLGLIIVFSVLFIQNLIALPFIVHELGYSGSGLGPFWVVPETLELVALTILLYLSE